MQDSALQAHQKPEKYPSDYLQAETPWAGLGILNFYLVHITDLIIRNQQ